MLIHYVDAEDFLQECVKSQAMEKPKPSAGPHFVLPFRGSHPEAGRPSKHYSSGPGPSRLRDLRSPETRDLEDESRYGILMLV
jgi:hypothetical protein